MWCCVRSCSLSLYANMTARTCSLKSCSTELDKVNSHAPGHASTPAVSFILQTAVPAQLCSCHGQHHPAAQLSLLVLSSTHLGRLGGASLHHSLRLRVVVGDVDGPSDRQCLRRKHRLSL